MGASIYERQWTEANGNALTVDSGVGTKTFVLGFPPKFEITKVVCKLVSGSNGGYDLDIFDLPVDGAEFDEDGDGSLDSLPPAGDEDIARVIPTQSDTAGIVSLFATGTAWPYMNKEGSFSVPKKRIFVRIDISSQTGDNVFELAIAGFNVTA